jgi:hypothetical protein
VAAISVLVLYELAVYTLGADANWPLEQTDADHPVGNTFGELIEYRTRRAPANAVSQPYYKQHNGLDILAQPCCGDSAPYVVVTAGGKVDKWDIDPNDNYSSVEIAATTVGSEYVYTYMHLEHPPLANPFQAFSQGDAISAGTQIAMVRDAFPCGYNHLHYGIAKNLEARNPLEKVAPEPDDEEPVISNLHLVKPGSDPPSEFGKVNNCPTVSGAVDIIVEVSDKDAAGSSAPAAGSLGIYDLKWRACAIGIPECDWNDTHKYDDMPPGWTAVNDASIGDRFSLAEPFRTIREEWSDVPRTWTGPPIICDALPVPRTFMFVAKDGAGWDTQELVNGSKKYRDGTYVLSVKAIDYGLQEDIHTMNVCVDNPGS